MAVKEENERKSDLSVETVVDIVDKCHCLSVRSDLRNVDAKRGERRNKKTRRQRNKADTLVICGQDTHQKGECLMRNSIAQANTSKAKKYTTSQRFNYQMLIRRQRDFHKSNQLPSFTSSSPQHTRSHSAQEVIIIRSAHWFASADAAVMCGPKVHLADGHTLGHR